MEHTSVRSSTISRWSVLRPGMLVVAGLCLVFMLGVGPVHARVDMPGTPSGPLEVAPGWDLQGIFDAAVVTDTGTLSMWYTAFGLDGRMRVGYATSMDGKTWQRYGTQPVLDVGPSGAWDEWQTRVGAVLKDGATYRMWYWCYATGVGYATSPDGIQWTKYAGNPVLTAGPAGSWDDGQVVHLTVLKDDGLYKMWYSAMTADGADGPASIGYATSPDGITWTKYDGNPVLSPGASGWDAGWAFDPSVIRNGDSYMMWYAGTDGFPSSPVAMRIGLATSPDGVTWTKSTSNPVMDVAPNSWERTSVTGPWVILDGGKYRMWYHGGPWGPRDMIGYATSDDGVTWTKYEGNPVLHNSYLYLPLAMRNYDTYLYDNFDKPAYDATFDPGLWSLHWTSEVKDIFHAEQHDGAMVMWNSLPAAMGGGEFVTMQPLLRTLQQLQMYEARLKISSDRVGGLSQVGLFIKTFDEINGRYWFTQCVLQASGDAQQATYACHVMTQDPGTGDSTLEHGTPAVTVPYDTWHTARIEVNPATAEFRYYLDGTPIDTYVPNDAPALIAETNIRASLLAWNDYADAASTRYVDDVRIAPARP